MSALHAHLNTVFGQNGWLTQQGGFHLPEQLQYALSVADWLTGSAEKPVGMIEGDTGTGKTLGYLFPIVLQWSLTGQRSVIATHTIALQNQILNGDLLRVEAYLSEQELPIPRVKQRLGMRHFVDPIRVARLNEITPSGDMALLLEWAQQSAANGTGLINKWLEDYGPLPDGVTSDAIAISQGSPANANPSYEAHKNSHENADIILTSHMMVLLEARTSQPILNLPEISTAILFDEADQLPSSAESLSSRRLQMREIRRELQSLIGRGSANLDKHLLNAARDLDGIDQRLHELGSRQRITELALDESGSNEAAKGLLEELKQTCASVHAFIRRSALGRSASADNTDHGDAHTASELLSWVEQFNSPASASKGFGVSALAWSPVRQIPSLVFQHGRPAMFASNLWRNLGQRVCLTSATLGTAGTQTHETNSRFITLKVSLGISKDATCVEQQYAPKTFGDMAIILADPQAPKPIIRHNQAGADEVSQISPDWITYVAAMAKSAMRSGPTLILAASYAEAATLGIKLRAIKPLVHRHGQNLNHLIADFTSGHHPVLITPAAWQGTSIRNNEGGQWVQNLIVTRIPFQPPNPTRERLAMILAERDGYRTPLQARKNETQNRRHETLIKLRQGIGRLIRSKSDEGTLWIADPRFPHQNTTSNHRFYARAIPDRFYPAYERAHQFTLDGQLAPTRTIVPPALQEFINS